MNKYQEFIDQFGASPINNDLLERFEKLTGKKAHKFLRREIFYAQRDFDQILDLYEKGEPFYIYTGRGPSFSMHIGHIIPFEFAAYLQNVFDVYVIIQMTDDEKYFTRDLTFDQTEDYANKNIKDIMKCGFNPEKTFIFKNSEYIGTMYHNLCRIQRNLKFADVKSTFGFEQADNMGKISFPPMQMVPCLSSTFPHLFGSKKIKCLIPCAIDQDPYFRLIRDITFRMGEQKPALIFSKYIPSLQGPCKMSSSVFESAIYLDDTRTIVAQKIKNAFSGGGSTKKEHERFGANLEADVSYQYLRIFLDSDDELQDITVKYGSGKMYTREIKEKTIEVLDAYLETMRKK